jgi:O-antigen ligase
VKDRFPFFAGLAVGAIIVQESLTRQGSANAVATVLIAALAALLLVFPGPKREGPPPVRIPLPVILFVAFSAVRLANVPSVQGVQNWLVWFLFPTVIVLVARRTTEGTPVRVYRPWLVAVLVAGSIYGALTLVYGPGYDGRIYSDRGVGWVLLPAMALVIGAQLWRPAPLYWPVWFTVLIIGDTLTRTAGAVALLCATGLAALNRKGRFTAVRYSALLAVMGYVGFYAVTQVAAVRDRFTQGDNALQVGGQDFNTSGRLKLWSATWHAIPEHPWVGHGPGQAQYFIHDRFITIDHPHNEYLRMLYDTGWIGLVLWTLGLLLLLRGCWRRMRHAQTAVRRGTHLAAVLALLDFMLGSITDNLSVGIAFILICATLVGLSHGLPETPADEADDADEATHDDADLWPAPPPRPYERPYGVPAGDRVA